MEWVQALNHAIAYIEDHLEEDIQCSDVADAVHISSFHFQRAFSMISGMTVQTYIRNRRLSLAGEALMNPETKVIDVAIKYGYESAESFSKAFQRYYGILPSKVSKHACLKSFNRMSIKITMEGGNDMEYRVEQQNAMKLLLCTRKMNDESSSTEIPKFWNEYFTQGYGQKVPGYLGVCFEQKPNDKEFLYGIGCNGEKFADIPKGYELYQIPAYQWVIFQSVGPTPDAIQSLWKRIYEEWMLSTNYEVIFDYWIENYLPGDNNADDYVCEVWIPVKEKNCKVINTKRVTRRQVETF